MLVKGVEVVVPLEQVGDDAPPAQDPPVVDPPVQDPPVGDPPTQDPPVGDLPIHVIEDPDEVMAGRVIWRFL
ncbi:hypothetical protein V6N13_072595 [Hibiscus sabdariffa]